ncbi:60S ribosomal protein L15, partial [Arapaima gigas]
VELVTLAQATALLARGCQATHLSVLVHRLGDPLGVGVASDGLVEGVNEDHLKELVCGILAHPVGVQNPQGTTMTTSTLLSTENSTWFNNGTQEVSTSSLDQ